MDNDWKEEARGLPVWAGASIGKVGSGYVGTAYQVGQVLVYGMCHKDAAGFRLDWRTEAYPDLSDPDTNAAFVRRLAVRLGAPEGFGGGAVAELRDSGLWIVAPGGDLRWCRVVETDADELLLALVRAWRGVA